MTALKEMERRLLQLFWEKSERGSTELQELLGVSRRELQKLIRSLRSKGFSIKYDRRRKLYSFTGYSRSKLAALLSLSLIYRKLRDEELKLELLNYIREEFGTDPFTLIELEEFGDFREHLFMTVEGIDLNLFWKIQEAIRESKELRVIYKETSESPSQWIIVRPIYLASLKGYWYLISYEPTENSIRLYRLDNIEAAFYTGRTFKVSEDFFLEDHLPMLTFYLKPRKKHRVKVLFDRGMEWVADRIWHPTQEMRITQDGRVELSMTVANIEEFFCWLASFGYRARLISPKGLVEQYKSFISLILNLYDERAVLTSELDKRLKELSPAEAEALREAVMETLREEPSSSSGHAEHLSNP